MFVSTFEDRKNRIQRLSSKSRVVARQKDCPTNSRPNVLKPFPRRSSLGPSPRSLAPNPRSLRPNPRSLSPSPRSLRPNPRSLNPNLRSFSASPRSLAPTAGSLRDNARSTRANTHARRRGILSLVIEKRGLVIERGVLPLEGATSSNEQPSSQLPFPSFLARHRARHPERCAAVRAHREGPAFVVAPRAQASPAQKGGLAPYPGPGVLYR